jgi:DHA2 family multidrug resistance protein
LAQQHLGYTATLAGLVLSPGALCIIFLIPVIQRVMPYVQTRLILTVGFVVLGAALLYSMTLTPDIDFHHLVLLRAAQSLGIGFLFVPTSTLTYLTLPKRLQGDAAALFTMFRNIAGSVGISLGTAMITSRTQVHMAYLSAHTSDANPNYIQSVASTTAAVQTYVQTHDYHQTAVGYLYQTLMAQSAYLAYIDVFGACALMAFLWAPFTLFFSPVKMSGSGGGGH